MAIQPGDNMQIANARTIDELVRWASLEQAADNVLWIRKFGRSGTLAANTTEDVWETGGTKPLPYTAGESITQQSHFTVPAGYTLFTLDARISAYRSAGTNAARGAEVDQMAYVPDANTIFQTIRLGVSNTDAQNFSPRLVANTPEKTTLWYQATADTNNTVITTSASYLLVKGDYNLRTEI